MNKPRNVAVSYFFIYSLAAMGGLSALIDPPSTVEGAIGALAMAILASMLLLGGVVGAPAALLGVWRFERTAVIAIGSAAAIYGLTIIVRQFSMPGSRILHLSFVLIVLLMQYVRWQRIKRRPYDPARGLEDDDDDDDDGPRGRHVV